MAVGEKFALSCAGCGVGSPAGQLRAGAAGAERRDLPGHPAATGSAVPQGWVLTVAPVAGSEQREPWAG